MKFRLTLLVLCLALALQAQEQMNVSQLAEFLRSEMALKQHTDKQIAAYLKKVKLTEKLPNKTIEDLEAQGAGPKTVDALKALQTESATLKPPSHDATYSPETAPEPESSGQATMVLHAKQTIPPPNSVRQQEILDQIKQYSLNYTQNLPNFVCVQVTRRWVQPNRGPGSDIYHSIPEILAKLSYNEGQEHYQVYSVGGHYTEGSMESVGGGGAVSTGEFGSLLRGVFEPRTEAEFSWDHWGKLRGRRMAVFHYSVDSGHSDWSISYSGDAHDVQRIVTAYQGLVYADENTGEVTRVEFEAVNIPKTFPVTSTTEILDYDLVEINGQKYMCPFLSRLFMTSADGKTKNETEFRDYRRFGTESDIKFGDVVTAPPPPPGADKTDEQPLKDLPKPTSTSDPFSLPSVPGPPPK